MTGKNLDSDILSAFSGVYELGRSWSSWNSSTSLDHPKKNPWLTPLHFFQFLPKFRMLIFLFLFCPIWPKNSDNEIRMPTEAVWWKLVLAKVFVLTVQAEKPKWQEFGLWHTFCILWGLWTWKKLIKLEFKHITRPPQKEPLTDPLVFLAILAKI